MNTKYEEFVRSGHSREVEEAIKKQHSAVDISSRDDEGFGEELDRLGVLPALKYEQIGGDANLEEAIEKAEEAVNTVQAIDSAKRS